MWCKREKLKQLINLVYVIVCGAYFFEFRGRNLVCFVIAYNFNGKYAPEAGKTRMRTAFFTRADRANLLFFAHTLCMNNVTNTFLLVGSSVRSKQPLCFLHGQCQKREQKPTTILLY